VEERLVRIHLLKKVGGLSCAKAPQSLLEPKGLKPVSSWATAFCFLATFSGGGRPHNLLGGLGQAFGPFFLGPKACAKAPQSTKGCNILWAIGGPARCPPSGGNAQLRPAKPGACSNISPIRGGDIQRTPGAKAPKPCVPPRARPRSGALIRFEKKDQDPTGIAKRWPSWPRLLRAHQLDRALAQQKTLREAQGPPKRGGVPLFCAVGEQEQ